MSSGASARTGALSETVAQFVAEIDGVAVGQPLGAVIKATGQADHLGRLVDDRRAFVVGVYVRPEQRGSGAIDALLAAAADWVAGAGTPIGVMLDVHRDNRRAQGAYRRAGFDADGRDPHRSHRARDRDGTAAALGRGRRSAATIATVAGMTAPRRLLLVNGPNLNLLGIREPDVYGTQTLQDVEALVTATAGARGFDVRAVQSNHEGVLIDAIHDAREDCAGIVINPGGLTHTRSSCATRCRASRCLSPRCTSRMSRHGSRSAITPSWRMSRSSMSSAKVWPATRAPSGA